MASHLIRVRYSQEGYKGMLNNPGDRGAPIQKLLGALDMQVHSVHFSPTSCEAYILCDASGDPVKIAAAEMIVLGTGAVADVQVLSLIDSRTMVEAMTLGGKISGMYKPPGAA